MAKKRKTAEARAKKPTGSASLSRSLAKIDREIVEAINRRAALVAECDGGVASSDAAGLNESRHSAIQELTANNAGPAPSRCIEAVLREIDSGCRALVAPVRVAYLGPEHSFSHLAATWRFGASAELIPVGTIAAVFEEVQRGTSQMGVAPLENSTDGRVTDTLECFSRTKVRICGELPVRIHHCLLGGGKRADVRLVYSKPQALSQCRNWLAQHLPRAEPRPVASTSEAARLASDDPSVAAIASEQAGVSMGLAVMARNIEDQSDNITRFAVLCEQASPRTGADKTSLMFETPHEPGALADAMAIFKRNRLNLTWIESFPVPGSRGRYLFFVEFIGHQEELRARRAIAALGKKSLLLEVLGSYAQTEPIG